MRGRAFIEGAQGPREEGLLRGSGDGVTVVEGIAENITGF
jgi:hypothetical protein